MYFILNLNKEVCMSFQITDEEKEKIKKLPKWANDLITRMGRVIDRQESKINTMDTENPTSNVQIQKYGNDVNLPTDSHIKFTMPDSIMMSNRKLETYNIRNEFTVSIKTNVRSGVNVQMLEIYSPESIVIENHASNVIWIHPRDVIDTRFLGMKDSIKDNKE